MMKYLSVLISITALIISAISVQSVNVKKDNNDIAYSNLYNSTTTVDETKENFTERVEPAASETTIETKTTSAQLEQKLTVSEKKTTKVKITTTVKDKNSGELFHITIYIPSKKYGKLTASGETARHLQTCAVDPKVIPLGSTVYVNGLTLRANDTGSAVKGNVIDIFYDGTREDAINWIAGFGDYHTVTFDT